MGGAINFVCVSNTKAYRYSGVLFLTAFAFIATQPTSANAQLLGDFGFFSDAKNKRYYKPKRKKTIRRQRPRTSASDLDKSKVAKSFDVDDSNKDPIQIVISLPEQRAKIYKGEKVVASTRVSTGKAGHRTPQGIFSIIQKNRRHFSNLYHNAPMPYMQRITWSGLALHAGYVPSYPASHGCIRMPNAFARKLFGFTNMGAHVVVTKNGIDAAPTPISHDVLFQPIVETPENEETADLSNEDGVTEITTSAIIRTAATLPTYAAQKDDGLIPSHIHRLKGREKIKAVQRLLNFLGYEAGRADGDLGSNTRSAMRKFKRDFKLPYTRGISDEFFEKLYLHANREDVALGRDPENPEHAKSLAKPLRILITRRSDTERVRDVQRILRFLGYYQGQADGIVGRTSTKAIKKFQYEFMMAETGLITDELVDRLFEHANWGQPATGHLYVRQDHKDLFDAPITISESDKPLGSHLYSSLHFEPGDTEAKWLSQTLKSSAIPARKKWDRRKRKYVIVKEAVPVANITASEALDRLTIPQHVRVRVSELLTPGSSLIVADGNWTRETGLGTDFIVLAK